MTIGYGLLLIIVVATMEYRKHYLLTNKNK